MDFMDQGVENLVSNDSERKFGADLHGANIRSLSSKMVEIAV